MRTCLHILTKPEDGLPAVLIDHQREEAKQAVKVFDLTVPDPDYRALLEAIFSANSVSVW